MIRIMVVAVAATSLTGCVDPQSTFAPPTVDMRGVNQQKYYQDLAECTQQKRDRGFFEPNGPIISKCMTDRGYNVTIANT